MMVPALRCYGLDIETDTALGGLDPALAPVVAVALALPGETRVVNNPAPGGDTVLGERQLLVELIELIENLPAGALLTWRGASFDLPFLAKRLEISGMSSGLVCDPVVEVVGKYPPLKGHASYYQASWMTRSGVAHAHLDIAAGWESWADAREVTHSLKPVARAWGLSPVEVDRSAIHLLSAAELDAYVGSDAEVARELGLALLSGALLSPER